MTVSATRASILQKSCFLTTINPSTSPVSNDSCGLSPSMNFDDILIGYQNIGVFPEFTSHPKNDAFRSFLLEYEFDIFGVGETNLKWSNLPAESQFCERIRNTWSKTHSSIAYNRTKSLRERGHVKGHSHFQQYGGVALLSTTQAAHRVSGHGRDSTGLGCWTWTSYQGKGSVSLKVVAAYRPCQSDGALSTYSQHVNYLYEKDDIQGKPLLMI
jgi:hypothetical protein